MTQEEILIDNAKNYLCGYQLCLDMLNLRRYERRRAKKFDEECNCEDVLMGNEAFWKARMYEAEHLIASMRSSREKLILYYHYIKGESIQHTADFLCISRRTAYRLHQKGLLSVGYILERMKKQRKNVE